MKSGRISGTNTHTGINVVVFVVMRTIDYTTVLGLLGEEGYASGGGHFTRINKNGRNKIITRRIRGVINYRRITGNYISSENY